MKHYVSNHGLKNRILSEKEITEIFFMHFENPHFHAAIIHCETTTCLSPAYIDDIYKVPAIADTINHLDPTTRQLTKQRSDGRSNHEGKSQPRNNHINALAHSIKDENVSAGKYDEFIDSCNETPFV